MAEAGRRAGRWLVRREYRRFVTENSLGDGDCRGDGDGDNDDDDYDDNDDDDDDDCYGDI